MAQPSTEHWLTPQRNTGSHPAQYAEDRFLEFTEQWGAKYPAIVRLWENAWPEFVPFLQFDKEIRRIVCNRQ